MVKSIGGALALVASFVTLLAPTAALAHAKWFADYDMVGQPRAIGSLLEDSDFAAMGMLAVAVTLLVTVIDRLLSRAPAVRERARTVGTWAEEHGPLLLRWGTALALASTAILFRDRPVFLTPELAADGTWVVALQLAAAAVLLQRSAAWYGALGIAVLYVFAVQRFGWLHLADYPIFVGLAIAVVLSGHPDRSVRKRWVDVLRVATGITFLWGGIEKFAYPQWSYPILAAHPELLMGFDAHFWMMAAGWIECAAAMAILLLRFGAQIAAALLFTVCVSAVPLFGAIDAIGHAPFLLALALVAITPKNRLVPRRWAANPAAHGAWGALLSTTCVATVLAGYVALHQAHADDMEARRRTPERPMASAPPATTQTVAVRASHGPSGH